MKKTFSKIILFLALLIFPGLSLAQTNDFSRYNMYGWGISDYHADIDIQKNSEIQVTEKITADFRQASARHGIIRYLPIHYKDRFGQNLDIRFTLQGVTDENGNSYETAVTYEGDNVRMRIGSADTYVDGEIKTYIIKYHLARGLNQFDQYDEFYWNVTGNGWDTVILKASATVKLPESFKTNDLKSTCYTGFGESKEQDCIAEAVNGQTYEFSSNSVLPPNAGLTIVAGFPKGMITYPSILTYITWFFSDNWGYLIPLLALAVLYYRWYKYGRDPVALHPTVMPEYDAPDNLRPAQIGTLIDDRVDMQDITSTIIDLATRGYLKIIETKTKQTFWEKTDYELEKTTPKEGKSSPLISYERIIYNAIFENDAPDGKKINLEDLKYKFYKDIPGIQKDLYANLVNQKYYDSDPEKARNTYFGFAGGLFFVLLFFLGFMADINLSLYIGLLLCCPIIGVFGFYMPKKTQKGADTLVRILGLEEFIKTAEKDRLKFYEQENIFEKILPYAIALGLADKWAKACEGLFKNAPDWYQSSDPNFSRNFNTWYFLNTINSFNSTMSTNMTAAPRSAAAGGSSGFSSGGGFSGGGFGGGGGSSW